jgi:hypothetical protein
LIDVDVVVDASVLLALVLPDTDAQVGWRHGIAAATLER